MRSPYPTERNRYTETDASEATTETMKIWAGDVRTRPFKQSRGINARFGRRGPTEDDVPRRLASRFGKCHCLENTTDDIIDKSASPSIDRSLHSGADARELTRDPDKDGNPRSCLRPLPTSWETQSASRPGPRPVEVDIPRRSDIRCSIRSLEVKPANEINARDSVAGAIEFRADDVRRLTAENINGVNLGIGVRGPTENDICPRLATMSSQDQTHNQESTEMSAATATMAINVRFDQPTGNKGECVLDVEMDRKENLSSSPFLTSLDIQRKTVSWASHTAVKFPPKGNNWHDMCPNEDEAEHESDPGECPAEEPINHDSAVIRWVPWKSNGVNIRVVGEKVPAEDNLPRRLVDRLSHTLTSHAIAAERSTKHPEIAINRRHFMGVLDASEANLSVNYAAISRQRPVAVDIPRRSSSWRSMYSDNDREDRKVDSSETTTVKINHKSGHAWTRPPMQTDDMAIRIGARAPTEDALPRHLPSRFNVYQTHKTQQMRSLPHLPQL